MINTSQAFKECLKNDERNYSYLADVTLHDGRKLNLTEKDMWGGFRIEDAVSADDELQIGSAIINKFTFVLNNMYDAFSEYDFADAQVQAAISLKLPNGTSEKILKGIFTVDNQHNDTDLLTLECLDNMAKFDRPYSESKLVYPATRGAIIRDACSCCGVVLSTVTFDGSNEIVSKRPEDQALTFRQVIAWIAQLSCKWARCNTLGQLELGWYDTDTLMADVPTPGKYHNIEALSTLPVLADDDVVITGIRVVTEDADGNFVDHLFGTEGYILEISGNELIQPEEGDTIAAQLGALIGLKFRPMELSTLDDPSREAGDIFFLTDDKGRQYRGLLTKVVFNADDYQSISCGAEPPAQHNSVRYSETTRTYVALRKLIKQEKTDRELAIENLNKVLENSSGLYPTYEEQPDGSTITYFHDKPTLAESKNVIKITADAVGVSNDGGKTYPFGFFLTGTMITKLLYAEGINADYIDAGAITVKDQQGKIIFQADFATGKVTISGDCVMIGDRTATEAIQDAMDTATAAASNMTMQLDNDHATVPVDADGKYEKFPEGITTRPIVMYGSKDVTDQCSFSITESTAISGTWDNGTRTYVVTALEADTAWVDIKATYLGTLSVSKRFTVSKLHAGIVGPPGRVYSLEMSVSIVKIGKDNVYNPDAISAAAYYREDTDARRDYNGRFRIRETADGYTWSTIYESTQDESNIEHYLYTLFRTTDGKLIQASNGSYLAMPRAISEIEVSLFSAGDAGELIDIKRVSVLKEVAALTQEEIFNILTDDGAVKGIYKIGKELYVNATYMRAGVLADLLGRNRWNLETGEFRLSGMATVDGKLIADKEAVAATEKALKEAIEKVNNSVTDVEKQINMENVFNLWFQNGKTKGFLLDSNGDLYVSFSYARGGTLKLGGVNNGNGLLSILDANGSQVGYIDNTGVHFNQGEFSGKVTAETGKIGGFTIDKTNLHTGNRTTINSVGAGAYLGNNGFSCSDGKNKLANLNTGYLWIRTTAARSSANGIYMERYGASSRGYISAELIALEDTADELITEDYFRVNKSGLSVRGSKNRIAKTNNYQDRLLYCYEMGSPFFGDIGTATIGADGKCFVDIDDIFSETVIPGMEYYVFLQKEGEGDLYVSQKTETYFEVSGTPGLRFSWELKARQSGYGYERLNNYLPAEEQEIDYAQQAICMMNDFYQEQEE